MSNSSSDAVIDVRRVCCHGIEFRLGIHLRPPSSPRDASAALPAWFVWVQAASPPPTRAGGPWEDGLLVNDGGEGQPFRPRDRDDGWKRQGVRWLSGIASLDQPKPSTVVLDRWLAVRAKPEQLTVLAERAEPSAQTSSGFFTPLNQVDRIGFLSVPYPLPTDQGRPVDTIGVDYAEDYQIAWTRLVEPGGWVAISLDRFWPPERDSADYIAQVEDCTHLPLLPLHEPVSAGQGSG